VQATVPAGFRENLAGLIVPEAVSRRREVWTYAEWRTLERATTLLTSRKVKLLLACHAPHCAPIERIRNADGGLTLRCGCTDRVIMRRV
jgi:hypothetical protein